MRTRFLLVATVLTIAWFLGGGGIPFLPHEPDAYDLVLGTATAQPIAQVALSQPPVTQPTAAAQPTAAVVVQVAGQTAAGNVSGLTMASLILTVALIVLVIGFFLVFAYLWWANRHRFEPAQRMVTPTGQVMEISSVAPPTQRPSPRTRRLLGGHAAKPAKPAPTVVEGTVVSATPAAEPIVSEPIGPRVMPWTVLTMQQVLKTYDRLEWDENALIMLSLDKRERMIRELQAKLNAATVRIAPDYSVAEFVGVTYSLDVVRRKVSPLPVVIDIENGLPLAVVALAHRKPAVAPAPVPVEQPAAPAVAAPAPAVEPKVDGPLAGIPILPPLHTWAITKRLNTAAAASSRSGKTTALNTLLVADLARGVRDGVQAVVCSSHFTPFHPVDQPIDLRPLLPYFEAIYDLEHSKHALEQAGREIEKRKQLYRAGEANLGHPIILYLGEWYELYQRFGNEVVEAVRKILFEGAKFHVYIGFIEYHNGLVAHTGGDSALRAAFGTRMVTGSVDTKTWKTFAGDRFEPRAIPKGFWMTESGVTQVMRPAASAIAKLAHECERVRQATPPTWMPLGQPAVEPQAEAEPVVAKEHVAPVAEQAVDEAPALSLQMLQLLLVLAANQDASAEPAANEVVASEPVVVEAETPDASDGRPSLLPLDAGDAERLERAMLLLEDRIVRSADAAAEVCWHVKRGGGKEFLRVKQLVLAEEARRAEQRAKEKVQGGTGETPAAHPTVRAA